MSWTNGGLLGVGGLEGVDGEVDPMRNPDEDTSIIAKRRIIKPKGTVCEKKSRR